MPKIEQMYAFIIEDTGPEDEGLIGMATPEGWMPLVGADMERVESLRPIAKRAAAQVGKPVKLIRFTTREELEVIDGT